MERLKMNFPTVAQVKAHIRVEIEDEEDDLIQENTLTMQSATLNHISISVYMRTKFHRRKATEQFLIRVCDKPCI